MKALLLIVLSLTPSAHAYFYELECDANFQPKVGEGTVKQIMKMQGVENSRDLKFTAEVEGFNYEVVWDKVLDSFYMTIKKGDSKLLFSTARVPTFGHNDTMSDVVLPDGTRRWISCAYKPKPKN